MTIFKKGDHIYFRGRKTKKDAPPSLYSGQVVEEEKDHYLEILVEYQVGIYLAKPHLFLNSRRGKNRRWVVRFLAQQIHANLFASEEELKAAVETNFGVAFENLSSDKNLRKTKVGDEEKQPDLLYDNSLNLPHIPVGASLVDIVHTIGRAEVCYFTGRLLSNEAIAAALYYREKNKLIKERLGIVKDYFQRKKREELGVAA